MGGTREENLKELGVDGRIVLECIIGKQDGKVWAGCIWIRIRTSGGLFGFHKKRGVF
jgi:hypothetical protein